MAVDFQFASALICEKVLRESDGVVSAIRIVDVYTVAEDEHPIHFYALISLKAVPVRTDEFCLEVALVDPLGARRRVAIGADYRPQRLKPVFGDPSIPTGVDCDFRRTLETRIHGGLVHRSGGRQRTGNAGAVHPT